MIKSTDMFYSAMGISIVTLIGLFVNMFFKIGIDPGYFYFSGPVAGALCVLLGFVLESTDNS